MSMNKNSSPVKDYHANCHNYVTILGDQCPVYLCKNGKYVVDLWGKTVFCKDGMDIISLRDNIEKSAMSL